MCLIIWYLMYVIWYRYPVHVFYFSQVLFIWHVTIFVVSLQPTARPKEGAPCLRQQGWRASSQATTTWRCVRKVGGWWLDGLIKICCDRFSVGTVDLTNLLWGFHCHCWVVCHYRQHFLCTVLLFRSIFNDWYQCFNRCENILAVMMMEPG